MKKIIDSFRQVGIILAFLLSTTILFAQQKVTGVVKSAYDEPLIGVNVVVKGSTQGTVTDFNGRYSIEVPNNKSVLEFTYIGFVSQQITVGNKSTIDITLVEDSKALEEVVVIGYGVQKKSVVTASIAKVGSEELAQTAPVRVDNALKGLAAGVQVTTQNGQPGTGSVIRVRGTGTINTADPLYIVARPAPQL